MLIWADHQCLNFFPPFRLPQPPPVQARQQQPSGLQRHYPGLEPQLPVPWLPGHQGLGTSTFDSILLPSLLVHTSQILTTPHRLNYRTRPLAGARPTSPLFVSSSFSSREGKARLDPRADRNAGVPPSISIRRASNPDRCTSHHALFGFPRCPPLPLMHQISRCFHV